MRVIFLALLVVMFGTVSTVVAADGVITMGYKDKAKMPLIGGKNDDSGMYIELFSKAASKIGYQLKIVRDPKKRIHKQLGEGTIDFYPGASFSQKRAKYLYYLPNGMKTKEVLVSRVSQNNITDMTAAKGRLLVEAGSSKVEWDKKYPNLKIVQMSKLPMETVVKAMDANRGDFYIADIEIVDYYKKANKMNNYKDIGLKIHEKSINDELVPMYMGFSKKSPLFSEKRNEGYDSSKEISLENFPTEVSKDSIAYRFYQALDELNQSGETQRLYNKYFK